MNSNNKKSDADAKNRAGGISPGWTALDNPVPIGTSIQKVEKPTLDAVSEENEGNQASTSAAMYVSSQESENSDVMGQIANEFQQAALIRKSSNSNKQSSGNGMSDSGKNNGQAPEMQVEDTEIWSGDEGEQREQTGVVPHVGNDLTYSTIGEGIETSTRQNTDTSNTITLSSDGGSQTTILGVRNGETVDRTSEQINTPGVNVRNENKERLKKINENTRVVPPTTTITAYCDMNTVTASSVSAAPIQSVHVDQGRSMRAHPVSHSVDSVNSRRPPDGRNTNNRRSNNSVNGGSLSARTDGPVGTMPESNGVHQKSLLEVMGIGLGNFTNDMANIVIEKLRPEYDTIAKRVGQSVKEETTVELAELREKVDAAEKLLNHLEQEKNKLHEELIREKDHMRKEIDKEKTKRMKEVEEKDEKIDKLEKELKKAQMLNREKDRMSRRSESKAKTEEHKRVQAEETYDTKLKELQKEISRLKSEILVQKSKNRVQSANAREVVKSGSLARKLKSYHESSKGKWPTVHPKHVPYDEGDP